MLSPDVTHLDDNAASEFVSGNLAPSALGKVERHLAGCRDCRALVAALAADGGDSHAATVPHERESPSQAAQRPTRHLTIGDRVGRYLVLSALGAGGMGIVFAAYDPQLDRKVALKLLRSGITYNTKDARTRLRREAQAIAQLSHPNVVGVYDVGATEDGDLYIAMEFVEGDTLTTWLRAYPRTWREIVDVFLQAARGLFAAHSVGLLHRDFKPDNVLVGGDGRVRVTDFGLARSLITPDDNAAVPRRGPVAALSVELTATGTVLGTPRYMAPEQLTGPDIDARADQFSFCVALYEALYGVHPLPGATSVAMLEKNEKALAPPETAKIPSAIGRVVQTGLERERAKRYPTMSALISALAPAPARPRMRYLGIGLAALLAIGGATYATVSPGAADPQPVAADPTAPLLEKINELQTQLAQRDAENRKLVDALKAGELDTHKIRELEEVIAARNDKIDQLVAEVVKLRREVRAKALPPTPQGVLVVASYEQAYSDLESCFVEWSKRQTGNVDLTYQMTVSAEGRGHSCRAVGMTLIDDRIGPSLRQCAADVLERIRYPQGVENLDVAVGIEWSPRGSGSGGVVSVSAHITGRRATTQMLLD